MKRLLVVLLSVVLFATSLPVSAVTKAPAATAVQIVNLNAASATELQALPGIGQVTADRIVAYRTEHGAFARVEDLIQVKGVGDKTLEKIRSQLVLK